MYWWGWHLICPTVLGRVVLTLGRVLTPPDCRPYPLPTVCATIHKTWLNGFTFKLFWNSQFTHHPCPLKLLNTFTVCTTLQSTKSKHFSFEMVDALHCLVLLRPIIEALINGSTNASCIGICFYSFVFLCLRGSTNVYSKPQGVFVFVLVNLCWYVLHPINLVLVEGFTNPCKPIRF